MQERLRAIWERIKEWWLKLNNLQRGLMIGGVLVTIVLIVVLANVFGKTKYVVIRNCENASEVTEVRSILDDAGIGWKTDSSNNLNVMVATEDEAEASIALGASNISSNGYTLADATSGGFSTTESDRTLKQIAYLESKFEKDLESSDVIRHARVNIKYTDTSSNIFSQKEEYTVTAILKLNGNISDEQAEAIGKWLATNIGATNPNSVYVVDSNMNPLYTGGTGSAGGSAASVTAAQKVKAVFENALINKATDLFNSAGYNIVKVLPNLDVNFDDVEIVDKEFSKPDSAGDSEGLTHTLYEINSEGSIANASGVPGSSSNDSDDTSYQFQNTDGNTSTYTLKQYEFYQNEKITTTKPANGNVVWNNSSMSVVATKNEILLEEDAETLGYLEEMTWDEYKAANSEPVLMELTDDVKDTYLDILAQGSGIPKTGISFIAYHAYTFVDRDEESSNPWLVLEIILAILIVAALIFIVLRSMRPVAVGETEPELSVEDMLATTKQQQETVADIDLQEKSETRRAIEKFVEENPETVALLLRNWLNDGWG